MINLIFKDKLHNDWNFTVLITLLDVVCVHEM